MNTCKFIIKEHEPSHQQGQAQLSNPAELKENAIGLKNFERCLR